MFCIVLMCSVPTCTIHWFKVKIVSKLAGWMTEKLAVTSDRGTHTHKKMIQNAVVSQADIRNCHEWNLVMMSWVDLCWTEFQSFFFTFTLNVSSKYRKNNSNPAQSFEIFINFTRISVLGNKINHQQIFWDLKRRSPKFLAI